MEDLANIVVVLGGRERYGIKDVLIEKNGKRISLRENLPFIQKLFFKCPFCGEICTAAESIQSHLRAHKEIGG